MSREGARESFSGSLSSISFIGIDDCWTETSIEFSFAFDALPSLVVKY